MSAREKAPSASAWAVSRLGRFSLAPPCLRRPRDRGVPRGQPEQRCYGYSPVLRTPVGSDLLRYAGNFVGEHAQQRKLAWGVSVPLAGEAEAGTRKPSGNIGEVEILNLGSLDGSSGEVLVLGLAVDAFAALVGHYGSHSQSGVARCSLPD